MYGKKVKLRLLFLSLIFTVLILTVYLVLKSLEDNVVYFISPSEINELGEIDYMKKYRVGGMVKKNTLNIKDQEIRFIITDFKNEIEVSFKGTIPNLFAEIERPSECEIQYLDYFGKEKTLTANGLLATCIQHEVDHLKGILFIDYLSKLKKDIILKKLSKQKIDQKRLVI